MDTVGLLIFSICGSCMGIASIAINIYILVRERNPQPPARQPCASDLEALGRERLTRKVSVAPSGATSHSTHISRDLEYRAAVTIINRLKTMDTLGLQPDIELACLSAGTAAPTGPADVEHVDPTLPAAAILKN